LLTFWRRLADACEISVSILAMLGLVAFLRGKVLRRDTRHVINRAATALRIAVTTLLRSHHGAFGGRGI
jgi:hypothetical protein